MVSLHQSDASIATCTPVTSAKIEKTIVFGLKIYFFNKNHWNQPDKDKYTDRHTLKNEQYLLGVFLTDMANYFVQ